MIGKEEIYRIGTFHKPHGIHGDLQFSFTDDVFSRAECDYLVCPMEGIFVPFYIESYRLRSGSTALIKLEGVDSVGQARQFANVGVYFPIKYRRMAENGELSWNSLIGFQMEDVHDGLLGEVTDVDTTTLNTLFVVRQEERELLVPAQEDLIRRIEEGKRRVTVELPEGLLNLDQPKGDMQ